ncbi:MAG TPA: hypothetical protein VHB97_27340 [Polyangia bacterium]|nr:hypothetical protein [Polyangia bacterium]
MSRRALVTIEPRGPKTTADRQYLVRFTLELDAAVEKTAVLTLANAAMAPLAALGAECAFGELAIKTKTTSIEARAALAAAPTDELIQTLRATLSAAGYTVGITAMRECNECLASVMVPWNQADTPPPGWHAVDICGKHQYKSCGACGSIYVMSSTNASGPAPSLHCEVCNTIMVEWGGTKVWFAELVSRR